MEENKVVDLAQIDNEEEEEFKDAVAPPEYDVWLLLFDKEFIDRASTLIKGKS